MKINLTSCVQILDEAACFNFHATPCERHELCPGSGAENTLTAGGVDFQFLPSMQYLNHSFIAISYWSTLTRISNICYGADYV